MIIRIRVKTTAVGSEALRDVEVDDDAVAGLSVISKKQYLEDVCFQNMLVMLQWDWEVVDAVPES